MRFMGTLGQRFFQIICVLVVAIGLLAIREHLKLLLPDIVTRNQVFNLIIIVTALMTVVLITAQAKAQYWATVKGTRPLKTFANDVRHHAVQLSTALAAHGVTSAEVQDITTTLRTRLQAQGCPWEEMQTLSFAIEQLTECLTKYWQHTGEVQVQQVGEDMAKQVAHDMRSPVTVLTSVLRFCKGHTQDAKQLHTISMGEKSLERLAHMAADLCNVAKARVLDRQPTDVGVLARSTVDAVRTAQADARVALHYVGPENFTAPVDSDKLQRVLTNLLQNGVQAIAAEQSGAVTLSLSATEEEIQFVVHDTGSGMSEATQAKLFQRLFTTKGAGGTGLGLAYCKDVITGHGGKIQVESAPNLGSTFRVTIPTPLIPATPVLHLIDGGKPSVAVIEG